MDDLLLSKIRIGIIAELLASDWIAFSALQQRLQTTNGNLGAHLGKLIEGGYVDERKAFVDRRPQSRYRLTQRGRDAFVAHVREMQAMLQGSS